MRSFAWSAVACGFVACAAGADDRPRFVERTPMPRFLAPVSPAPSPNPPGVKARAVPSVTQYDTGGYVGGSKLLGNNVTARGPVATGPLETGTYGADFSGFHVSPNRVFLAPSYDPSIGPTVARAYRTDGPFPPDVFTLRPFRKAVLEQHKVAEERAGSHP